MIEEALAQERRYETERIFLDKFKQAYEHFDPEMKNLLRSLIKNNKAFHGTSAVSSLYVNKLICKVADIDNAKKLYSINPLIADYVQAQWEAEIQSGLDDFFADFSPLKSACLDMLELNECSFDGKIRKLKKSLFTNKHLLSPVLRTTYTRPEESFFIYFNDGYLSSMEKRLSKSFIDEIEIILK
ncbi:hypothetical protein BADSM9389_35530 [Buttiauxella agrestis]|nr:hypothetical protein BADSM9389_35530 [Buttiauxella agrestis]